MAYMPADDLVDASSVEALTSASPDDQLAWYTQAKGAVERFCNQVFAEDERERIVDGSDERRLPLDVRLATLSDLTINSPGFATSLAVTDVAINEDHDAL